MQIHDHLDAGPPAEFVRVRTSASDEGARLRMLVEPSSNGVVAHIVVGLLAGILHRCYHAAGWRMEHVMLSSNEMDMPHVIEEPEDVPLDPRAAHSFATELRRLQDEGLIRLSTGPRWDAALRARAGDPIPEPRP